MISLYKEVKMVEYHKKKQKLCEVIKRLINELKDGKHEFIEINKLFLWSQEELGLSKKVVLTLIETYLANNIITIESDLIYFKKGRVIEDKISKEEAEKEFNSMINVKTLLDEDLKENEP
jgi:hypothetical protein